MTTADARPLLEPLGPDPLVSVLIVNYNYERFLGEAIESVLAQTYRNFELIVCDDGSTDGSRQVIEQYERADERIRSCFQSNAGVAAALNSAYAMSTGSILCLLDADDIFAPTRLSRAVDILREGGRVGMVMNTLVKVDSGGAVTGRIPEFGQFDRGELSELILRTVGSFTAAPTSALAMRRECAARVFPIPTPQFRTEADAYMRNVAALFYAVEVIEEPLTTYRVHSSNVTASQTIDLRWCQRGISTSERLHDALGRIAAEQGWTIADIDQSPFYCEMRLVCDYLHGANGPTLRRHLAELRSAARSLGSHDRAKMTRKARLLAIASSMPRPIGNAVLEQIYQPTKTKRALSRLARALR